MLYYKLPFYGKRGSIGEIKESKNGLEVFTYDIDGKKFNNTITIRNTKVNKNDLLNLFFQNVEEYLTMYKDKFYELKKKEDKVFLNKNIAMTILIISILFGIGVPTVNIFLGSGSIFGTVSLMIGATFATASIISLKKCRESDIKNEFLKTYSNLSHELNIYKEEKKVMMRENKEVRSRSLSLSKHDKDRSSVLIKTKVKEN